MKVRPLRNDEPGVGKRFIYYENPRGDSSKRSWVPNLCPTVILMGFVRSYKSPYEEEDNYWDGVCVVQEPDGEIILALEKQLFVEIRE